MQWKPLLVGAAIATVAFWAAGRAFPGDDQPEGGPPDPAQAPPGAEHDRLKAYVGEWDGTGTLPTPGGDIPVTMHQSGKMILAGRFLSLESKLTVGSNSAQMIEFVGYDPGLKKYVHTAMEDDTSRISYDMGDHDAAKKMVVMSGTEDWGGGKVKRFHYTVGDVVDGAYTFTYYEDNAGGEKKIVEMAMKKR